MHDVGLVMQIVKCVDKAPSHLTDLVLVVIDGVFKATLFLLVDVPRLQSMVGMKVKPSAAASFPTAFAHILLARGESLGGLLLLHLSLLAERIKEVKRCS